MPSLRDVVQPPGPLLVFRPSNSDELVPGQWRETRAIALCVNKHGLRMLREIKMPLAMFLPRTAVRANEIIFESTTTGATPADIAALANGSLPCTDLARDFIN